LRIFRVPFIFKFNERKRRRVITSWDFYVCYSPVFVEQIVQFAFSNVEREIADENGRHDDDDDDDDDAELPMEFARLCIQRRQQ